MSDQAPPPPPTTLAATQPLLSEQDLFNCRLQRPLLKQGAPAYASSKKGSIPFDPQSIRVVSLTDFLNQHQNFVGNTVKGRNTIPPVDWRNPLFHEKDNRTDLTNKVYLPLSRVLANRGIAFDQDVLFVNKEGEADTVAVDRRAGDVRVVVEEEPETLFQTLLAGMGDAPVSFPNLCVLGRQDFLHGHRTQTSQAKFQFPLILAQVLGYMRGNGVCSGIIITSGRAVFVWIDPINYDPEINGPTRPTRNTRKMISVTEELPIDHPHFLRVMASFLVESFNVDRTQALFASKLLSYESNEGGFRRGPDQEHQPTPRTPRNLSSQGGPPPKKSKPSGGGKGGKKAGGGNASVALAIPQLSRLPTFKQQSIVAPTLGRERKGKVFTTEWHGIPAAVKVVYTDVDDQQYARDMFHSEVEAYKIAGSAGLWGKAVPAPLFIVETNSKCAIGMVEGTPMPLEPMEWTLEDLQQGTEAVQLLHQSGVTLTDIKPANFVKLTERGTNGNMEETEESRVVAIDLEGFWKDTEELELPLWLIRQGTPLLTMSS